MQRQLNKRPPFWAGLLSTQLDQAENQEKAGNKEILRGRPGERGGTPVCLWNPQTSLKPAISASSFSPSSFSFFSFTFSCFLIILLYREWSPESCTYQTMGIPPSYILIPYGFHLESLGKCARKKQEHKENWRWQKGRENRNEKRGESGGKSPCQDSQHIPKGWTVAAKGQEHSSYEPCISQTGGDLWETKNVAESVTTVLSSHGRKETTVLQRDTDTADRRG